MAPKPKEPLLMTLFNQLEHAGIRYCVMHGYATLPHLTERASDVDMCIDACERKVDDVIHEFAHRERLLIVLKLHYDIPSAFFYVLQAPDKSIIKLDFLNDPFGINSYLLRSNELLQNTRLYHGFRIPNPATEAVYLLIKKARKKEFLKCHRDRLVVLYRENRHEINTLIKLYFGARHILTVQSLLSEEADCKTNEKLVSLNRAIFFRHIALKPWKWPTIIFHRIARVTRRVMHPSGILVCLLSPDGGGKSSVAQMLQQRLSAVFRKSACLHWRPGLLPRLRTVFGGTENATNTPVTNPHSHTKPNRLISFCRWIYYSLDYVLGYYLKLLPMKMRTTLILMDRYYYDIVVDPIRYGFRLPQWLMKLPLWLIPPPEVVIYLDNTPQGLLVRKQELPEDELARQISEWRRLIPSLPNGRVITTDKAFNAVVEEAADMIVHARASMTRSSLAVDPPGTQYVWASVSSGTHIAIPSKKYCRWIVPTASACAKKAWDLYIPCTLKGGLARKTLQLASSHGILKLVRGKGFIVKSQDSLDKSECLRKCLETVFDRNDLVTAVSTGTPGIYRKTTIMVMTPVGVILGYVKIGDTPLSVDRVKNEHRVLTRLSNGLRIGQPFVEVPRCLHAGQIGNAYILVTSVPSFNGVVVRQELTTDHAEVINNLIRETTLKQDFTTSEFCRNLREGVSRSALTYRDLLMDGLDNLLTGIGHRDVSFALSHGDFAPWNMIWKGDGVFLYDWEAATFCAPIGIDVIHFLFQTGFLLKRLRGRSLLRYMWPDDESGGRHILPLLKAELLDAKSILLAYLLNMAVVEDSNQPLICAATERRALVEILINR